MRYCFGFMCVVALAVMGCSETTGTGGEVLDCEGLADGATCTVPAVGEGVCIAGVCEPVACDNDEDCDDKNDCTEDECTSITRECLNEPVPDGTACAGGTCQSGVCALTGSVLPCNEQGIRNAIAAGTGPYTFDCNGPTTVVTGSEIVIDNNVILNGQDNLTVDADFTDEGNFRYSHTVFSVADGVTAELIGLKLTEGGFQEPCSVGDVCNGPGMTNDGTLALTNMELSKNMGGIEATGTLTLTGTTVSFDDGPFYSTGTLTLVNSTVSNGVNINNDAEGTLTVTNSTIFGAIFSRESGTATLTNSLVVGECGCIQADESCEFTSLGYNIESPGDTCGFDQTGDLVNITEGQLDLGDLANNGGPTMTHALGVGSVAIDHIPPEACLDAEGALLMTDQRGLPRPAAIVGPEPMCDVGSVEVQPGGQ